MSVEDCFHLKDNKTELPVAQRCLCELKQLLNRTAPNHSHCVAFYFVEGSYVYNPDFARGCPLFTTEYSQAKAHFTALTPPSPNK